MNFNFEIDIIPIAKARPRKGKHGFYTPKKTKDAEDIIKWNCVSKMKENNLSILNTPIKIDIIAYMPIPKSYSQKKMRSLVGDAVPHTKRPDADNIAKLVMDALNKVLWTDDCLVYDQRCRKYYSFRPRIFLSVSW